MIETLRHTTTFQPYVDASTNLLNHIQHLCAKWWEISREFFNLHSLYAYDDSEHAISSLIWRS